MKKLKLAAFVLILVFGMSITSAYAYRLFNYRLINGVHNVQYTIQGSEIVTYGGQVLNYGSYVRDSFNSWNNAVDSSNTLEDVYITEITDITQSEFDTYCIDFGETPWIGWCNFYDINNISMNPDHQGPTDNWKFSKIRVNVRELVQADFTDSEMEGSFVHEIGHGIGLQHSTDSGSVMNTDILQQQYPNSDDIAGVKAAY